MNFRTNPPLGLYVHLPWCERKCPYCDFNSHQAEQRDESAYVQALIEDLQQDLPLVWGRQIHSIFIGGGTPSLFSADAIEQLMSSLRACLNFSPAIEVTLEANPGSADASRFRAYRDAGINRLSIGIQSFNDKHLQALGRIHDRSQALAAFEKARQAGFDNINLDLMYALPGQSITEALIDIEQAISLQPEHISHYQLTIEPNTLFHKHEPSGIPSDDDSWMMQQQCQSALADQGYQHYEISAYARPQRQSRHNLNYWHFGDYLGIGAGAHGKITLPAENRVLRRVRIRQPEAYLQAPAAQRISQQSELSTQDLVFEFMLNALRLVEGVPSDLFCERTGLSLGILQSALKKALELDLLNENPARIQPSARGLQFLNDLQAIFLQIDEQDQFRQGIDVDFFQPGST